MEEESEYLESYFRENETAPSDFCDHEAFSRIKRWLKKVDQIAEKHGEEYFAPNFLDNLIYQLESKNIGVSEVY